MNKAMKVEKAVENGVVSGYKKIENGVVSGYKKIEKKFIDAFLSDGSENDDETHAVEANSSADQ